MITFLELEHSLDALELRWDGGEEDDNGLCTCTHIGCYATGMGNDHTSVTLQTSFSRLKDFFF